MADNIGTVVQGAHSGFYVYWAKHLGIDKEAFYLSERKKYCLGQFVGYMPGYKYSRGL